SPSVDSEAAGYRGERELRSTHDCCDHHSPPMSSQRNVIWHPICASNAILHDAVLRNKHMGPRQDRRSRDLMASLVGIWGDRLRPEIAAYTVIAQEVRIFVAKIRLDRLERDIRKRPSILQVLHVPSSGSIKRMEQGVTASVELESFDADP